MDRETDVGDPPTGSRPWLRPTHHRMDHVADRSIGAADPPIPSDRTVAASIYLSSPEALLVPTLSSVSGVTIRPDLKSIGHAGPLYISVTGGDFQPFETALCSDFTVANPRLVRRDPGYREYGVVPTQPPTILDAVRDGEHYIVDLRSDGAGWLVQMTASSRAALSAVQARMTESDVDFDLRELREQNRESDRSRETVPSHHEELLRTAYELGYFEVPRGCTQGDLAEEFDITPSAVSHQIRAAVRKVLEQS